MIVLYLEANLVANRVYKQIFISSQLARLFRQLDGNDAIATRAGLVVGVGVVSNSLDSHFRSPKLISSRDTLFCDGQTQIEAD